LPVLVSPSATGRPRRSTLRPAAEWTTSRGVRSSRAPLPSAASLFTISLSANGEAGQTLLCCVLPIAPNRDGAYLRLGAQSNREGPR
jgi:hypothetical protein